MPADAVMQRTEQPVRKLRGTETLGITPQKLDVQIPVGDTSTLLGYICDVLTKYARFTRHEDVVTIALWVAGTWFVEPTEQGMINGLLCFEAYPRLFLIAEPSAGKNRVMKILRRLVRNPTIIGISKVTAYGVNRALEDGMTVFIDEYHKRVGTQGTRNTDLQEAVLAYSTEGGAIDGKNGHYNEYSAFGPVVLAAQPKIESGNRGAELQDLFDRSFIIRMEKSDDDIPELDEAFEMDCAEIRSCLELWGAAIYQLLLAGKKSKKYVPVHDMPATLKSRKKEIANPLCFVADIAVNPDIVQGEGSDTLWAVEARNAVQVLLLGHGGSMTASLGRLAERYGTQEETVYAGRHAKR